jgi:hypothetical protein
MSDRETFGFGNASSAILAIRLMAGGVFLLLVAGSGGLLLDARSFHGKPKTNI